MPKQLKVGIIIVTYNSEKYISDCIASVVKSTCKNYRIVIVDNASTDDTINIVKKKNKKVHIFQNKKNLGFAAANNIAIKYFLKKKTADFILLLNPDTVIHKTLLTECCDVLIHHNNVGVVGPIITYMQDSKKIWFAGGSFNKLFCYTRHSFINKKLNEIHVSSGTVDFITGACLMIRSKMLRETGLLPEKYFLYFEDVFFCRTVSHAGYTSHLIAKPLVKHHASSSTGIAGSNVMTKVRAYYFARNPLIFIRYEVHGVYKITNFFGQFFIRLPHYAFKCISQKNMKSFSAYCKGIADGLRN